MSLLHTLSFSSEPDHTRAAESVSDVLHVMQHLLAAGTAGRLLDILLEAKACVGPHAPGAHQFLHTAIGYPLERWDAERHSLSETLAVIEHAAALARLSGRK